MARLDIRLEEILYGISWIGKHLPQELVELVGGDIVRALLQTAG